MPSCSARSRVEGNFSPPPSDPANAALRSKSTTGAYDGSQTFS